MKHTNRNKGKQLTVPTRQLSETKSTRALNHLMKAHGIDQTITLEEFGDELGVSLIEALEFLRHQRGGEFIAGRRGYPSRFVFGEARDKWLHQEAIRAEWRKRNGLNPLTGSPIYGQGRRPYISPGQRAKMKARKEGRPNSINEPKVKFNRKTVTVTVGDKTVRVPLPVGAN